MPPVARAIGVAALLIAHQASGTSLLFSNVDAAAVGRVRIPVDPPVPADIGATDFTLEFWMRGAAGNSQPAVPCDQSGYHWINGNIVFDRDRLPPNVRDFGLSIAGGRIVFGVESSNGSYTICGSSNVVSPQTWRHVAVQRRVADGMLFVYVDGELERSAQGPTGDISYPNGAQQQDPREPLLVIGREKYEFGPPGFRGWIDEVRLSRVLRYAADFQVPSAPFVLDTDTLALYHFDEGTGDTIVDQNANQSPAQRLYSVAAGPEWSTETPFGAVGQGQLRFAAATYGVGEGAGTRTVAVERGGGSAGAASVQAGVTGGTAAINQDFQLAPQTLTWADGDGGTKTFSITVVDDSLDESDETIVLTLSNVSGASLGAPASTTVTITDDDPASAPGELRLNVPAPVAEAGGSVALSVARVFGSDGVASVNYATAPGTATPGADYTSTNGALTWASGDGALKTFTVPILNDSAIETAETFTVTLSGATGAALGTPSMVSVTIDDDDALPPPAGTLQLERAGYSVTEGTTNVALRVTRIGGTNGNVTIRYATADGTASAGSDYTSTNGMLTWQTGIATPRTVNVPILDDALVEGDESLLLTLSDPTGGATVGAPSGAQVTIADNDVPPAGSLQFEQASYSVAEGAATITVRVTRTGGSNGPVSVGYATADGGAVAGADYTAASGTLPWPSGDAAARTINVAILNDAIAESGESFMLTLSSPSGGAALGGTQTATITIGDDDGGAPAPPTPPSSSGGGGGGRFDLLSLLALVLCWASRRRRLVQPTSLQTPSSST